MAGPSPSPSGSSRRLSELLDHQQEPFSLDLYLLEKGCSPAFLDAAVGGGGYGACSTCWPWPRTRSAGRGRTPLRPAAASMKGPCASGVLRLLLCKILRGKETTPTAKKKQLQPPAIDRRLVHVDSEKQRTPGRCESSAPPRRTAEASAVVKAEKEVVEDDEDDDSKRLSPDSVLEQSPLEHSPPAHEQKALLIFRELLQAAYSATLFDILDDPKDGSRSNTSKNTSTKTSTSVAPAPARSSEDDVVEEALAEATDLIATDMAGARAAWPGEPLQSERCDVGTDIAAAVLDALMEETATELMMTGTMDGHDFAVDTARRRHCWC